MLASVSYPERPHGSYCLYLIALYYILSRQYKVLLVVYEVLLVVYEVLLVVYAKYTHLCLMS